MSSLDTFTVNFEKWSFASNDVLYSDRILQDCFSDYAKFKQFLFVAFYKCNRKDIKYDIL